jgi:hypothetical protein
MDSTAMHNEAVSICRRAQRDASTVVQYRRNGENSVPVAAIRLGAKEHIDWMNKWGEVCTAREGQDAYFPLLLAITSVVLVPILTVIANEARSSARFMASLAGLSAEDEILALRQTVGKLAAVNLRLTREPDLFGNDGVALFFLKLACMGAISVGQRMTGSGDRLPAELEPTPSGSEADPQDCPTAWLVSSAAVFTTQLAKRYADVRFIPDTADVLALSPVWWRKSLFTRVPCALWMTADRTLILRHGQDEAGEILCALPQPGAGTITWSGCVGKLTYAGTTMKLDFQALPDERRALSRSFLGMTDSEWATSVGSLVSPAIAAASDALTLIALFKSRQEANAQIRHWRHVLSAS